MKNLILIRHAKSSWENGGLSDIERPLNNRGEKNAPLIGSILREKYNVAPDLVLTSSARRAVQTANLITRELNYPQDKIKAVQKLYSASGAELLGFINSLNEKNNNVILIGHNPELTEICNHLSGKFIDNMPTCGAAGLSFDTEWKDVKHKSGTLDFFIYPKLFSSPI